MEFDSLETKITVPMLDYAKQSMARPSVEMFVGKSLLPKRIFMISGLRVARAGTRERERVVEAGGQFELQATPVLLTPVHVGPDIGASSEYTSEWYSSTGEFVWAFV